MAENNSNGRDSLQANPNFIPTRKKITIILESNEQKVATKFDNGVDIVEDTLIEFGEFASHETNLHGNQFPVASTNGTLSIFKTRTQNGSPASLEQAGSNNQKNYIDSIAPNAKASFDQTSNSGLLNTDQFGNFSIKKGKQEGIAQSGNEIFSDINTNKENSLFAKRVRRVLIENTGYDEDNKFINNVGADTEDNLKLATARYSTLGVYGPKKFPITTTGTDDNKVTIKDMKRLGVLTLLAGAGDIIPEISKGENDDAIFAALTNLSETAPGLGRLGTRVQISNLDSNQLIKSMNPKFAQGKVTNFLDGKTNYSYGNVNTPFAQFAGGNSVPSITTAGILIGTVAGLVFSLGQIRFKNFERNVTGPMSAESKYAYMGSSTGIKPDEDKTLIEIPAIKNDFFVCLNEGIKVFFGFETNINMANVTGKTSKRIAKIHGYYNTVMRQVIRGISDLVGGTLDNFGVNQSENFKIKPNEIFAQSNPVAIYERLSSLSIIKFIKILVVIGDKSLQAKSVSDSINDDSISIYDIIDNEILREDENSIDPGILITKQNLKSKNNRSVLAASNKRSLLVMPIDFESAKLSGDLTANPTRAATTLAANNKIVLQNRISNEEVKKFEDYLEKDYLPFYFQDLRTNEILSFHAFLGEVNENLTAEYVENEGYGRMGTVPIYKNTKRTINFSFHIVSTNSDDFDEMWFKINKMGMFLFPQWSEGRKINSNGNNFIQPFSQVPAASPLIRLRIGDLYKSNYSKFGLAKLFGLSSDPRIFNIGNSTANTRTTTDQIARQNSINERVRNIANRRANTSLPVAERFRVGEKITIDISSLPRSPGNTTGLYKLNDGNNGIEGLNPVNARQNATNFGNAGSETLNRPGTTVNYSTTEWLIPEESTVLTIERIGTNPQGNNYLICRVASNTTGARTRRLTQTNNRTRPSLEPSNTSDIFIVPINNIRINDSQIIYQQAVQELFNETTNSSQESIANQQQDVTNIQNFFSDSGANGSVTNPIFKAFKSTEGRGIAGYIKSMTPDYNQSVWETEKFGGRAPKFMKIQIEFLPIWDLPPGLDHNGAQTAPVWNIGKINNDYHGGRGLETSSIVSYKNSKTKIPRY
jgi:hypothetical protein